MTKTASIIGLLLLPLVVGGCLLAAAAAVGLGVVAVVSEDTAQVDLHGNRDQIFKTASKVVEGGGEVKGTNPDEGKIEGTYKGSKVWVHVFPMGDVIRVRVQSRTVGGAWPDLENAKQLSADISTAVSQ